MPAQLSSVHRHKLLDVFNGQSSRLETTCVVGGGEYKHNLVYAVRRGFEIFTNHETDKRIFKNGNKIKIKIDQLQQKNQGFIILKNVAKVLNGNNEVQLIDNFSPAMITDLQYASVTSVDVERSFSTYKNILTDRRTSMTPEHMEQNISLVFTC
ncbi:Dimer Tnp hAT domain-containing protein [Aphis craccivora]|uniref:Dimer Tnp hAT domain-containing protein n=1 Tax=Aphis craccivora TaxID=307492 RepID=A0A6G0Z1L7_APHCR|nr:Dimer Tnp hAT domain-containing protein [Aphis craccivora]